MTAETEMIGSSSVVGLLAKPIVDLAVGVLANQEFCTVKRQQEPLSWMYRGDEGEHVLALKSRPRNRVAHLHVVGHQGKQWQN